MRIRCIHCSLRLDRIRRHRLSEESAQTIERIRRWVYPRDVLGTDYICHACWELIHQNVEQLPASVQGHRNVCTVCGRSILRAQSRTILRTEMSEREIVTQNIIAEWLQPRDLQPTDEVCIPCWLRAQRAAANRQQQDQVEVQTGPSSNQPVRESISPVASFIPDTIRRRVLIDFNFYIPINARICQYHLGSYLYQDLYTAENSLTSFTAAYIEDMVFLLRETKQFDFCRPESMDEHLFKYWFGRTKREYEDIISQSPRLNNYKMKLGFNALLCKMRTGDSDERISALFEIPRRTLEGYINQAREILIQDYVPRHLGFNHITRQEIISRNTYLATHLFGNPEEPLDNRNLIVIVDGTYINTQKSSNYSFQKQTYSLHKYHNLVKPFLIVCCNGYIIHAAGPYAATKNDATIMREIMEMESFLNLFQENDVFILDRGFRDCRDDLFEKGYQVHIPETIDEVERQLTTLQANITRCITMNRWVVEAVNGRFSRDFKLFRSDFVNVRCPHIMEEFKIAAALLNNVATQFNERQNVETIINIIQNQLFEENKLGQLVHSNNLNMRHGMFHNISRTNLIFPELSIEDLELIALGTYQIRQAKSYVGEHMREHGIYTIEVCREEANTQILSAFGGIDPYILRAKIKSRHVGLILLI